jgi:hypothetical protein
MKMLYPQRNELHITEFIAFTGTVGYYFCRIGDPDTAEIYYKNLREISSLTTLRP